VDKAKKVQVVSSLKEVFGNHSVVIVIKNNGITVADANKLRNDIRDSNSKYLVAKNSMAKLAITGSKFEQIKDLFKGPTAIAYSNDPVGVAKVLSAFAKQNEKFEILGGYMENMYLDPKAVSQLALLPSLDELRGKIVGLLQAPAQKLMSVLQAPGAQLARVMNAYSKKDK
jgi:large subunit ribosomal protein L10